MNAELLEIARWKNEHGDEIVFYRKGDLWYRHHKEEHFQRLAKDKGHRTYDFAEVSTLTKEWGFKRVVELDEP